MNNPPAEHPNPLTRMYQKYGLPTTLSAEQRAAWESHLAGRGAPLRLLPTNGDRCTAATGSPAGCGFPLLIDGTCPNVRAHTDHDETPQGEERG